MTKSVQVVSQFTSLTFKVYRFLAWNPIDENPKISEKLFFLVATFYAGVCVVQEVIYFILNFGGEKNAFLSLTNVAPCIGFSTLTLVKVSAIYLNRKKVTRIFKRLESLCLRSTYDREIEATAKTSKTMMKVLTVDYIILIWMFNLMPIVVIILYYFFIDGSYHKNMPYFMWYPWDFLQPFVYEICYLVVMWGAFVCAIGILSTDLMFCMIVTFINIQFSVLGREIKRIVADKNSRKRLTRWIDHHCELLEFVEEIEGIFSWTILINFVGSSVIICLVGIQTILGIEPTELVKFCLFLLSSLIQIFIICWHGQKLTDLSEAISVDVYNTNWVGLSEELKKDLNFIIMRCQKPTYLTALKFSKVSLHSYGMILSTASSYFAFMRNVYDTSTT